MKDIGLYIHVPFCKSKCPYCDFYSVVNGDGAFDEYTAAVKRTLAEYKSKYSLKADTLYFGGGTPSVLGARRLSELVRCAKEIFGCDGEITVECNPSSADRDFFRILADSGVNRISLGMQSAVDSERRQLGRTADRKKVEACISGCFGAGIENISLDVMTGVPNQTQESLCETADFCLSSGAKHISAYILSLEENTYFYKNRDKLNLPDDDETADMYLLLCELMRSGGFGHYEISNFAVSSFESRHNLKYWNCDEYLGIGPSAHSFLSGRRFYYDRDLFAFVGGAEPCDDGTGGDIEEYIMLRLRLGEGLIFSEAEKRGLAPDREKLLKKAAPFAGMGLVNCSENGIKLTEKGFTVSNTIIGSLIF